MSRPAAETARRSGLGAGYIRMWTAGVISNLGDGVALIAYPWLASAVTRSGLLLALIAVGQRLPWLAFSLPAGVITDRLDRRRIIVAMDSIRAVLTVGVAVVVALRSGSLPAPDALVDAVDVPTDTALYLVLLVAATLLGFAEVLRDNASQTLLPSLVEPSALERANGRMWGLEMVANSFAGPPLGSLLIAVTFSLPFFFDAGTFALAAVLVFLIPGSFSTAADPPAGPGSGATRRSGWWSELKEGVAWLWRHPLLRTLAVVLGAMNGLGMVTMATFVFFAQEVLGTSALTFALVSTGAAAGGIIGTFVAPTASRRLGRGVALHLTIIAGGATQLVIGLSSSWVLVWAMFALMMLTGTMWNVITVSLRQTIIPDHLLGRVNSVYRFFGWGTMSIGSAIGGVIVLVTETLGGRELALRMPWLVVAAAYLVVYAYAARRLTTPIIEASRRGAGRRRADSG